MGILKKSDDLKSIVSRRGKERLQRILPQKDTIPFVGGSPAQQRVFFVLNHYGIRWAAILYTVSLSRMEITILLILFPSRFS